MCPPLISYERQNTQDKFPKTTKINTFLLGYILMLIPRNNKTFTIKETNLEEGKRWKMPLLVAWETPCVIFTWKY